MFLNTSPCQVALNAQVFRVLEESRDELHLDEYGVSQTLRWMLQWGWQGPQMWHVARVVLPHVWNILLQFLCMCHCHLSLKSPPIVLYLTLVPSRFASWLSFVYSIIQSGCYSSRIVRKSLCMLRASLEQIFNDFAALQEEETGPVQGESKPSRTVESRTSEDNRVQNQPRMIWGLLGIHKDLNRV